MWTIRATYQAPEGQDVLVSQFLGGENIIQLASLLYASGDSPQAAADLFITPDRSRAEWFLHWMSHEQYLNWYAEYGTECDQLLADSQYYGRSQGVTYTRDQPPHEDYDWELVAPPGMIRVEDIFLYLSNATL
jgi:hypothetical protein